VINLPFHHPFHIAERMAFLDHLTRGRVTLGVGPSALPPDIKLFNIPFADLRPMMNESIDIIVKLLEAPEPICYDGKFWQLKDMALQLRSYQQPRLPLAIATGGSANALDLPPPFSRSRIASTLLRSPPLPISPSASARINIPSTWLASSFQSASVMSWPSGLSQVRSFPA